MFVNIALCAILGIALHKKTTWSWKFLIGIYVLNSIFGRIELLDEWELLSYFIFVYLKVVLFLILFLFGL